MALPFCKVFNFMALPSKGPLDFVALPPKFGAPPGPL